jgi:hypothetical protein
MATFSKVLLSGSTNGRQIKTVATATPGTLIHTAVSGTTSFDEVWLWVVNTSTTPTKLTVEWGGTTAPDDQIEMTVPGESGLYLVAPGLLINNSLVIRAFAAVSNVLCISGFINRVV